MKNRIITLSLLGILVTFFICYFFIINYYSIKNYPIDSHLDTIIIKANEEKWVEAEQEMAAINKSWNKLRPILSLNYAEADYSMFIEFLSRLESDIDAKEATQVASDASAALRIWNNFTKVVPQP